MFDFSYMDPRLLFPNITEGWALAIESLSNLLSLVSFILVVVAEWRLFRKLSEKPWKSLVPYYNSYILYKHSWSKNLFGFISFRPCCLISPRVRRNICRKISLTICGWRFLFWFPKRSILQVVRCCCISSIHRCQTFYSFLRRLFGAANVLGKRTRVPNWTKR